MVSSAEVSAIVKESFRILSYILTSSTEMGGMAAGEIKDRGVGMRQLLEPFTLGH